jgi:hypothetical protein
VNPLLRTGKPGALLRQRGCSGGDGDQQRLAETLNRGPQVICGLADLDEMNGADREVNLRVHLTGSRELLCLLASTLIT